MSRNFAPRCHVCAERKCRRQKYQCYKHLNLMNDEVNKMGTDRLRSRYIQQKWVIQDIGDWVDNRTEWYDQYHECHPIGTHQCQRKTLLETEKVLENRTKYGGSNTGEKTSDLASVITCCLLWLINSYLTLQDQVFTNFLYLVVIIRCFDWSIVWRNGYLVCSCFKLWKKNHLFLHITLSYLVYTG